MTRYEGHAAKLAEQISGEGVKSLFICLWLGERIGTINEVPEWYY